MKRPRWLRRGSWRPTQASGTLLIVQTMLLATCLVRGLDYLRPETDVDSVLSRVQDSAPLAAWGAVFVAGAAIGAIGLLGQWGPCLALGHLTAMVAYAGVAFGLFLVTGFGSGVRTPWGLAMTAVMHGAVGVGTFAALRRREIKRELPAAGA